MRWFTREEPIEHPETKRQDCYASTVNVGNWTCNRRGWRGASRPARINPRASPRIRSEAAPLQVQPAATDDAAKPRPSRPPPRNPCLRLAAGSNAGQGRDHPFSLAFDNAGHQQVPPNTNDVVILLSDMNPDAWLIIYVAANYRKNRTIVFWHNRSTTFQCSIVLVMGLRSFLVTMALWRFRHETWWSVCFVNVWTSCYPDDWR
jgi:hypothetical protein